MKCKHSVLLYVFSISILCVFIYANAADLRITDKSENVIQIEKAKIDYTSYSFIYTPDFEYDGIRVHQGEGLVKINWDRIKLLEIFERDTTFKPNRLNGKVVFIDNDSSNVKLVSDSKKGLAGITGLGEFSIDLEKVKTSNYSASKHP